MGTLTTWFVGVCTHIQDIAHTGQIHRCVLVNGTIAQTVGTTTVPPHYPVLMIRQADVKETSIKLPLPGDGNIITWPLGGVSFRVRHEQPSSPEKPVSYSADYQRCMFRLTDLNPGLAPLSEKVVRYEQPASSACYFDVNGGRFDVSRTAAGNKSALFAVLTTHTTDEDAVLEVRSFLYPGGTVTLWNNATIVFMNAEVEESMNDDDFLLHYLTVQTVPDEPYVPTAICDVAPIAPFDGIPIRNIGPGCSNSNYP